MKNTAFIVLVLVVCFLQNSPLFSQTPTTAKTDSLIHDDGTPDKADPGDTIQYKVTIDNSTGAPSQDVQLKTGIDPLSTFVPGSFRTSPLAVNDTFEVTGNVGINVPAVNGLLPNDFDDNTGGLAVVAEMKATTQGGSVTINTNGSFTYTPPAGFSGTDDFTYTLSDGNAVGGSIPSTDEATVILNVSNVIWFINNTGGGSGGTGTLTDPFKTLADFSASMGPAVGHLIYIEETGTSYNGGIVLKNNQILFGEGHTGGTNLADVLPFSAAPHSIALPAINGTFPVIMNSGGNGVTLAQNNTLNGFTAGNSSGTAMTGAGFGTLTVNNVVINSTGQALSLINGTVAGSGFNSVTSTGGTNNISLGSVSGILALGGGALSGSAGASFFNDQGTAVITYNGTISKTTGIRLIDIQNKTGGSITFGGALTHSNVTGQEAVRLDSNTGSTINFTGGVNITSSSTTAAFSATGGGTINVTGAGNIINSASSAALNVQHTTIGANGLTFQSISSGNNTAAADPSNGIVLTNTGTVGGLMVTGTGSAGSGGTIQNTSAVGVLLTLTSNTSLNYMLISHTGSHGIYGLRMSDGTGGVKPTFEITNSRLTSPGNEDDEHAMSFGNSLIPGNNSGKMVIAHTIVEQYEENGLQVYNNMGNLVVEITGTLSGLTNSTTKFDDNNDTHGQQGILITAAGTAHITNNVSGVFFNNIEFAALDIRAEGSNASIDVNWIGNVSINGGGPDNFPSGGGFQLIQDVGGTATYDIKGNYIRDLQGDCIVIIAEGPSEGRIGGDNPSDGNVLSGSLVGDGIRIDTDQLGGSGDPSGCVNFNVTVLIKNNSIGNDATFPGIGDDGIQILHRDCSKTLNLTIENNTIANAASEAIRYFTDADNSTGALQPKNFVRVANNTVNNIGVADAFFFQTQDTAEGCFHISGNTFMGANRNISLNQSNPSALQITQANTGALSAANTGSTSSSTGTITFNGICTNPVLPSNP